MIKREFWVDHRFNLEIDPGWIYNIINRLEGTIIRLRFYTSLVTEEEATLVIDNKWSIKQELGHLIDLERLHLQRVEDFGNRVNVLSAADMSNAATHKASHNDKSLEYLLQRMEDLRKRFTTSLLALKTDVCERSILHPRLQVMMKPVDMAFFAAEHDDHHLNTISLKIKELLDKR